MEGKKFKVVEDYRLNTVTACGGMDFSKKFATYVPAEKVEEALIAEGLEEVIEKAPAKKAPAKKAPAKKAPAKKGGDK